MVCVLQPELAVFYPSSYMNIAAGKTKLQRTISFDICGSDSHKKMLKSVPNLFHAGSEHALRRLWHFIL